MRPDDGLPPLRDVIKRHELRAKKGLGQNFLLDFNLIDKVARAGGPLQDQTVLEVGPGPGGLTRALLAHGASVIAVERDRRCIAALQELRARYPDRLRLIEADARMLDYMAISGGDYKIIANLPYNVGTALLINWLSFETWPPPYTELCLMFQLEVAERIVAAPGSAAYGRLSVLAQWRTKPQLLFKLPPQAFTPAPKVSSALVKLTPDPAPCACRLGALERLTAAAFGQRRKMLRTSLKPLGVTVLEQADALGIDLSLRAEMISVDDYCRLAACMG